MKEWKKDFLTVRCFETRVTMGDAAAADIEAAIWAVLSRKENCNMIFAAAPSQNEVLAGLREAKVDWSRIHAFHMDEYIGLPDGAPQSFASFLKKALFDGLPFGSVEYINGKYYVFYHRQTNRHCYSRQACAEEIKMNADGTFTQAEITSCGLNGAPLKAKGSYEARIACNL